MTQALVLHGPNLNLLGSREPEVYGSVTLNDVDTSLKQQAAEKNISIECFQSNAEHELIEKIHTAKTNNTHFIIINPGAFTHTSIAIRDALAGVAIPFIEIHISNVHAREEFRKHSYLSDIAVGVICGLGVKGYNAALTHAINTIKI